MTTGSPQPGGVRERILDAALQIAVERGYEGTTITLVTQRAGVSVSSVYHQFSGKDELLAAVLERGIEQWREAGLDWLAAVPGGAGLTERVAALTGHLADRIERQPAVWQLGLMLALEQRPAEAAARARFRAVRAEFLAAVADWLAAALPGGADPGLPAELARVLLAVGDGYLAAVQAGDDLDTAALARALKVAVPAAFARAAQAAG